MKPGRPGHRAARGRREGERSSGGHHLLMQVVALHALTVVALDADGGVDAEPAGALPREHVLGDLLVQEAVAAAGTTCLMQVVAKDAVLDGGLQSRPVIRLQAGGLVKLDRPVAVLGEHPVEDQFPPAFNRSIKLRPTSEELCGP